MNYVLAALFFVQKLYYFRLLKQMLWCVELPTYIRILDLNFCIKVWPIRNKNVKGAFLQKTSSFLDYIHILI